MCWKFKNMLKLEKIMLKIHPFMLNLKPFMLNYVRNMLTLNMFMLAFSGNIQSIHVEIMTTYDDLWRLMLAFEGAKQVYV